MIFWRGKGLLVVLSFLISSMVLSFVFPALNLNVLNRSHAILMWLILGISSAAINFFLTKKFVSDQVRYLIDEETGQRVEYRDRSSFMFIPNRYWTWIFLLLTLLGFIPTK